MTTLKRVLVRASLRALENAVDQLTVTDQEDGLGPAWEAFARRHNLMRVAAQPDPGNPGREIATYTVPPMPWRPADLFLLVMVDASPDRTGRYGLYGELTRTPDPLTAQAEAFGVPPEVYAATCRAT